MARRRQTKNTSTNLVELLEQSRRLGMHGLAEMCWREGRHFPTVRHQIALAKSPPRQKRGEKFVEFDTDGDLNDQIVVVKGLPRRPRR